VLHREPTGGAFKGRHLSPQGEKVLLRKDRPRKIEPTVALVDLDPRATEDRLEAREELRRVPFLDEEHNTAVGTALAAAEAEIMHAALKKNIEMFAWTPADMPGVFRALRGVNMKLNIEKCTFRVEGGKFLGFKLNPDKCQAILNMRSPNSVKEVQQLLGRLTALSRFVPCLTERTRPMVQLLRKGKKFAWDDQCEEIFKQFKEFLTSPTVIQKPIPDHPILVYLAVSEEAVSVALIQETEGEE